MLKVVLFTEEIQLFIFKIFIGPLKCSLSGLLKGEKTLSLIKFLSFLQEPNLAILREN